MASWLSSGLGIAGIFFVIIGVIAFVIGIILLAVISSTNSNSTTWWGWALIGLGIILLLIGGIMLFIAFTSSQTPTYIVVTAEQAAAMRMTTVQATQPRATQTVVYPGQIAAQPTQTVVYSPQATIQPGAFPPQVSYIEAASSVRV
jgi:uncharacterized membrane protein